jgi:hypothetical protein
MSHESVALCEMSPFIIARRMIGLGSQMDGKDQAIAYSGPGDG